MSHISSPTQMRERAQHACEACRISKRKCDNSLPCYPCVRKGLASSCIVTPGAQKPTDASHPSRGSQIKRPRLAHQTNSVPGSSGGLATESGYPTPQHQDSSPSVEFHPRILLGSGGERGEKVSPAFCRVLVADLDHLQSM